MHMSLYMHRLMTKQTIEDYISHLINELISKHRMCMLIYVYTVHNDKIALLPYGFMLLFQYQEKHFLSLLYIASHQLYLIKIKSIL